MKRVVIAVACLISAVRLIPHLVLLVFFDRERITRADLARWSEVYSRAPPDSLFSSIVAFLYFMTLKKEYRNVFYVRIGNIRHAVSWLCPPMATLQIHCSNIGPGFFIQHGIATLISADSIGTNCWVNQQVTIGYSNKTDRPTIGNDVKIHAGAKLVGKVKVGDNATIGMNTVVIANVPANCTVFGVPGQIVWRKKEPVR